MKNKILKQLFANRTNYVFEQNKEHNVLKNKQNKEQ